MDRRARGWRIRFALLVALASAVPLRAADDVASFVATIKAVGKEGAGNPAAAGAWKSLQRYGPDALPALLAGFDDEEPVVTNWLRSAVDAIGERSLREKKPLPVRELEKFVLEPKNPVAGRQMAYKWLTRVEPGAPARLLPGFLHDRSPDLRRSAVSARIDSATAALGKGDKPAAIVSLREALSGASDQDQVDDIAAQLKRLGVEVDLAAHFGFVRSWHLIGPFDNAKGEKLGVPYPPERGTDLNASYQGKAGVDCRWTPFTTDDPHGKVDFNKPVGRLKGVLAYALAVVDSPAERRAELRLGCATGIKVFLNGSAVFTCDEYYHGIPVMDQFIVPVTLRAGRNEILVKVGQNEDTGYWAENWWFQARVCDATGVAVPLTAKVPGAGGRAGKAR